MTDLHLGAGRPAGRLGNYIADVDRKLEEIVHIANDYNAAAILCAGDVFHKPAPAYSALIRFQAFMEKLHRRFITIPGSHDLFGSNLDALYRTAIGFLDRVHPQFELLCEATHMATRVGTISIGASGSKVLDIEMVHGSVLPTKDFGDYVLLKDYKTSARAVLVGHYHDGYDLVTVDDTTFICPGSVVRTSAKATELTRQPRVAIISDRFEITWRALVSAKPGGEVLAPPVITQQVDFAKIAHGWAIDSIADVDIRALLRQVAKNTGVSNRVLDFALAFMGEQGGQ